MLCKHGSFQNFFKNIPLFLSACACACLTISDSVSLLYVLVWCAAVFFAAFHVHIPKGSFTGALSARNIMLAGICTVWLLLLFSMSWQRSESILRILAETAGLVSPIYFWGLLLIGGGAAFYACLTAVICLQDTAPDPQAAAILESKVLVYLVRFLIFLGFFLCFVFSWSGYIWADEAYSLRIVQYNWKQIIAFSAADVHPPLYYLLLNAVEELVGLFADGYYPSVVAAKLFSALAFPPLGLLLWTNLRDVPKIRPYILLSLLGMSSLITQAVEIRMYSWALLFVTASFLQARNILSGNTKRSKWVFFILFSLLGAYCHVFALIAVAAVWLCLLFEILTRQRSLWKPWLLCACLMAMCYFPWLLVLLRQTSAASQDTWIAPLTLPTVVGYYSFLFPGFLAFLPPVLLLSRRPVLPRFADGFGVLVPLAVIFCGTAVSLLISPLFINRYLYPALMCLWIGILLLSEKRSEKVRLFVVALVILGSLSGYAAFVREEVSLQKEADRNMALMESIEADAVLIVTNGEHLTDVVASYSPNMVYSWEGTESHNFRMIYQNASVLDDISAVDHWIQSKIPVYYFESQSYSQETFLPVQEQSRWQLQHLGNYLFEEPVAVYRITPE